MPANRWPRNTSYGGITFGAGTRSVGRGLAEDASASDALRAARRRWASGVVVVTTREGAGYRGATVSAFTVVSLEPPLVLICLDREGRMGSSVAEAGIFAVSILDRGQEFMAERFAARAPLPDAQFTGVGHRLAESGCPVLDGSLAWFDCRIQVTHDGGDHVIVVGRVAGAGLGEDTDDPLLSYEGRYRGLEPA